MIYSQHTTTSSKHSSKKTSSSSKKTLKNKPKPKQFLASFQKDITIKFFEMLFLIKLFQNVKVYSLSFFI
jgi:hypothetical protein